MIFEQQSVGFTVLNVLTLHQKNVQIDNKARDYCAISLRYDSEAQIRSGGKTVDVSNALCFFPTGMPYRRTAKQDHMYVIHFACHTYTSKDLEVLIPKDPEKFLSLFKEAYACWNGAQGAYRHKTAALLCRIFALAYEQTVHSSGEEPLIKQAMQYLDKHLQDADLRVEKAAQRLHISPVYLRRIFSRKLQMSPKQYLLQKRMEKAKSLLEMHYFSVAEVADRCGFMSSQYFSVAFKKHTGLTPTEYASQA